MMKMVQNVFTYDLIGTKYTLLTIATALVGILCYLLTNVCRQFFGQNIQSIMVSFSILQLTTKQCSIVSIHSIDTIQKIILTVHSTVLRINNFILLPAPVQQVTDPILNEPPATTTDQLSVCTDIIFLIPIAIGIGNVKIITIIWSVILILSDSV